MFCLIINWSNIFFWIYIKTQINKIFKEKLGPNDQKILLIFLSFSFYVSPTDIHFIRTITLWSPWNLNALEACYTHFNHLWYVSRTIKSICSWDVHTFISRCYQQTCLIRFSTKHSCFVETDYKRLRNAFWGKLFIGQVYK